MKYPTLETERFFLRRPTEADCARAFRALAARAPACAPLADGRGWSQMPALLGQWQMRGHGLFAVLPQGEDTPLGLVGPWSPAGWPEPELGWIAWAPDALRDGSIAEALAAARDFAADLGWADAVTYGVSGCAATTQLAGTLGAVVDPFADLPEGRTATVWRHALPFRLDRAA